jgi:hypothetical protein
MHRGCSPGLPHPGRASLVTIRLVYVDRPTEAEHEPPPVAIEAVRIDGRLLDPEALRARPPDVVTVPASSERLEIDYTSLNLAAPERARFRYRMQGYEKNWTDARNQRVAHYHRPSPGHYRFEVNACNEDGVWSENAASMAIVVLPPFWQTWWFLGSVTAALLASVVGIVHYISHRNCSVRWPGYSSRRRGKGARPDCARCATNSELTTQVALLGELAEAIRIHPGHRGPCAPNFTNGPRDDSCPR